MASGDDTIDDVVQHRPGDVVVLVGAAPEMDSRDDAPAYLGSWGGGGIRVRKSAQHSTARPYRSVRLDVSTCSVHFDQARRNARFPIRFGVVILNDGAGVWSELGMLRTRSEWHSNIPIL